MLAPSWSIFSPTKENRQETLTSPITSPYPNMFVKFIFPLSSPLITLYQSVSSNPIAVLSKSRGNQTVSLFILVQVVEYRQVIEAELNAQCEEILSLLELNLIPHADQDESMVFLMKM